MTRVLYLLEPPDGGVAEYVRLLCHGMLARGHQVELAGPPGARMNGELREAGVSLHDLPLQRGMGHAARELGLVPALARLVRERGVDLVHAHSSKAGVVGRLAAVAARRPAAYTPHCFAFVPPGSAARRAVLLNTERAMGRLPASIVCVCRAERDLAARLHVAPARRLHVVYSGVAADRGAAPDPALLAFRGQGPLFGSVCVFREQKGLPHLLEAAALLARTHPAVRVALVGEGELAGELEAEIERLALGERVRVFPFCGRVEPHLAALDAFVLPSLWEAFPIAVLEAMDLGLAVVATDVGGTAEAVLDGRTGYVVPPRDPGALAARLAALADDPAGRAAMGRNGQEEVEHRFRLERMLDQVEALSVALAERRVAA